jgi:hypothetical protein
MMNASLLGITYGYNYTTTSTSGSGSMMWLIWAVVAEVVMIIAYWRVFTKAKHPGWAAIIPIYNLYILLKIAGRPGWWLILYLIPIVNIIVSIVVAIDVAKAFGKSAAFGVVGLWLFSLIGYLILGYGDAQYKGVPKHV